MTNNKNHLIEKANRFIKKIHNKMAYNRNFCFSLLFNSLIISLISVKVILDNLDEKRKNKKNSKIYFLISLISLFISLFFCIYLSFILFIN